MTRRRKRDVRQFTAREISRMYRVPDHLVGIPTPRWRRWIQRHITRRL